MARQRWWRAALGLALTAALLVGCSPASPPVPSATTVSDPVPTTTTTTRVPTGVDYHDLQQKLESRLAADPNTLGYVRSVVLSVDGTTVVSIYQHRNPTEQAHVWSVTKSVVSILVGIAVDEGRLRLDQTLPELLPDHADAMSPQQQAITLRQLLTMTAGMAVDDGGVNTESDDPLTLLLTYGMSGEPGAAFGYSNASAQLVAAVLHRAIERPILDYAREKLFDPLGIVTRPAWEGTNRFQKNGFDDARFAWMTDTAGTHTGAYGLRLTSPDLVKLGELYLNGGRWQGRQIVSQEWVAQSTTPQLTEAQQTEGQYGYFWWLFDDPDSGVTGFLAAGSWYQRIIVVPSRRVVLVVTADDEEIGEDSLGPVVEPLLFDTVIDPLVR